MPKKNVEDSLASTDDELSAKSIVLTSPQSTITNDTSEEGEVLIKRKTGARKDENQILRREQIDLYKSKILREDREKRYLARNGKDTSESPKKKKRVSFEDPPSDDMDFESLSKFRNP